MYIIPYYIKTKEVDNFKLTTAWIFMAKGGIRAWETDEPKLSEKEVVDLYLNPNGLHGKILCMKENTVYFEVDCKKTKLTDFYNWTDFLDKGESVPPELDIWRPFVWVSDTNVSPSKKDAWGWEGEVKDIHIQKFWSTIF